MELARVAVRKGACQAPVTAGLTSCTVPPRRPTSTSVASKDTGVAPIDTVPCTHIVIRTPPERVCVARLVRGSHSGEDYYKNAKTAA